MWVQGVNGGIVVFLCQIADLDTGLAPQSRPGKGACRAANLTAQAQGQGIEVASAPEFAEFLRAIREDVTYVNVHTTKFTIGEIRGQIK